MNTYLDIEEIKIGSWWARADNTHHGYCVISVDLEKEDVIVLDTAGKTCTIDYIKLQYRYYLVVPNSWI
jgi:hypothetical protein